MKLILIVATLLVDLLLEVIHVLKNRVLPHDFEADINVQ